MNRNSKNVKNSFIAVLIILLPIFLISNIDSYYSEDENLYEDNILVEDITNNSLSYNGGDVIYNDIIRLGGSNNYRTEYVVKNLLNYGSLSYIVSHDRQNLEFYYGFIIPFLIEDISNKSEIIINMTYDFWSLGYSFDYFDNIKISLILQYDLLVSEIIALDFDYIYTTQQFNLNNGYANVSVDIDDIYTILGSLNHSYFIIFIEARCPNLRYNGDIMFNYNIYNVEYLNYNYTKRMNNTSYFMFIFGSVYIIAGTLFLPIKFRNKPKGGKK